MHEQVDSRQVVVSVSWVISISCHFVSKTFVCRKLGKYRLPVRLNFCLKSCQSGYGSLTYNSLTSKKSDSTA